MLCLSERNDSVLMLSHYADKHTGVCLEFRVITIDGIPPAQVVYCDDFPVADFFELEPFVSGVDEEARAKQRELVERIYLSKAKDWRYEREWRLINVVRSRGFHVIPARVIRGVIFGCRTTNSDKERVKDWIAQGTSRPRLYQAAESEASYSLDITELEAASSSIAR
jgi:hypothetical protein